MTRRIFHRLLLCAALVLGGFTTVVAVAQNAAVQRVAAPPPPPPPPPNPNPPPRGPGGFGGGPGGRGGGRGGPPAVLDAAQLAVMKALYEAPTAIPYPADNPPTAAKLALGETLFYDPGLSSTGKVACASCHDVRRGFSDGRARGVGVTGVALPRHTPPVSNLAWSPALFWDGRAASLEDQALMPIAAENEMGMAHEVMVGKLTNDASYRPMFAAAFPGQTVTPQLIGKALAVFERSLTNRDAPFDRWVAGDETAISAQAKQGFAEFNQAGCAACHSGWNFTDGAFHDIGLLTDDVGRFGVAPLAANRFAFKTPSLRDVVERAPYMHTGGFANLQQVLRFYNNGFIRRASLAPEMNRVRAGGNVAPDIIAFLQTLTSHVPPDLVKKQEALDRATGKGG